MAADPFTVAPGELATPVLIAIGCLLLFVLLLAIQGKKASAPVPHEVADLGNHGEKGMTSTVFVEENGQVVRRSTRARKPTGDFTTPVKGAEEATPKVKAPGTRSKTPSRTPAVAVKETPTATTGRDETASPPRTRSRRTPRA